MKEMPDPPGGYLWSAHISQLSLRLELALEESGYSVTEQIWSLNGDESDFALKGIVIRMAEAIIGRINAAEFLENTIPNLDVYYS